MHVLWDSERPPKVQEVVDDLDTGRDMSHTAARTIPAGGIVADRPSDSALPLPAVLASPRSEQQLRADAEL
ncbi:hypothetical protein [Tsukamurella sp. 1534]|uniref:hypothetical protein n=1 Tax=Tsukamurella sp. 1534 TaxID=1151061 RepID=UPI0005941274|nr:hypothetical protein [Tsukamurella sp. 1534]